MDEIKYFENWKENDLCELERELYFLEEDYHVYKSEKELTLTKIKILQKIIDSLDQI